MSTVPDFEKPATYVAYGVFCYVAFLAVSAYAFGFVGNYWAVFGWEGAWFRSLDGRAGAPLGEAVLVDVLLIAVFGVQHSVMARRSFKEWSARFVPPKLERSTFVLAASVCLAVLFWQWRPIGFLLWDVSSTGPGWALVSVSLVGWAVVVRATFLIDHAELFGLRQAFGADRRPADTEFKTPGLYRAVRHPLYFGFLLAFWATPVMTVGHLLFAVGLTLYVLIAVPLEERDLLDQFGDRYRDYQKRVRALLPLPRSK
jgi:methanethiol S-methyltransferase